MRHLAIGDIHGCLTALTTLANAVPFQPDDIIITLGDYVDRGPDSRAVIDWLLDYGRKRESKLVALRGNHELMMSRAKNGGAAYDTWTWRGGFATLASYAKTPGALATLDDVPDSHWRFLEDVVLPYYEIDTHFFIHANAAPELPLCDQPDYVRYWEGFEAAEPHYSGKIMVCGHTAQNSGRPKSYGHAICIDTRAYGGEWLTCLDVATSLYWQANQKGEVRQGTLKPRK